MTEVLEQYDETLSALDELEVAWQQQTLQRIMADFIGEKRIPMLIIDAPNVLRDRALFSARGAGIMGF